MHSAKKHNYDLILLILLVLRIELDSNSVRYRSWNRESVSRSIRLGSTSAYTQISLSTPYLRYPHPKGLEQNELDDAAILFSRLNYFNSVRRDRESLITLIVNSPEQQVASPPEDLVASSEGSVAAAGDHPLQNVPDISGAAISELPSAVETLELTREEMDLIEILWKQDIDIGVSRDAYDSHQTVNVEKLKDIEYVKDKEYFNQEEEQPIEESLQVPDPFSGQNYTIDSETGEYVFDEFSQIPDGNAPIENFNEIDANFLEEQEDFDNDLLNEDESLDTFLPFENDNDFCDLSELFSPGEISQLIPDDLTSDPDYFLSQIEDVEKELEQFRFLNQTNETNSTRGDMFPTMDDCWPDATTMMPLLALGGSYQGPLTPVHTSSSLSPSVLPLSESFVMQASSVPSTEADFQPIASSVGTSSIGYAVAESIATLTNGSDPVPTGSVTNGVYGTDFPDLLYGNHTVTVSHNDLIPDLFLDEELQLMTLPTHDHSEKQGEDQMDTSCDSASSGHLPSTSDYHNWIDSCSESSHVDAEQNRCELLVSNSEGGGGFAQHQNFDPLQTGLSPKKLTHTVTRNESEGFMDAPFQQLNCNDQQFFTLKTYYSDPSENSACAISCGVTNVNKKFDYTAPKAASGYNCSNFLQHNHTYHMPFSNDDECHKPVVRDKQRLSSCDEDQSNKDEKKAKELNLPISIADIINLAIDEYNERLSKYELTEAQITLIRDIRRRGKNKVAAQNCRKRKMDQINHLQQDLGYLQNEKMKAKSKQNHLLQQKHLIEKKYIELYELILRSTNSRPPNAPPSLSISSSSRTTNSNDTMVNIDSNGGARTKRKYKK